VSKPLVVDIALHYELSLQDGLEAVILKNVSVTPYTNRVEETDDMPNETATGRMVAEGTLAISQDLFNHTVFPGDIAYVVVMNKCFIVEDTMNVKYTNSADVFFYKRRLSNLPFSNIKSDIVILRLKCHEKQVEAVKKKDDKKNEVKKSTGTKSVNGHKKSK
jgi:3D (Asp-Asp-Asp) domain-containing protein